MTPTTRSPFPRMARLFGLCLAFTLTLAADTARAHDHVARPTRQPKVQIALLLDNSGSMGGLLSQARTQLWNVVNEFAEARQRGQPVRVELALYEYGENVRRLSHFTGQLDTVSEQLFGLGIRGGDEWAGAVIQAAVRELEWSGNPDDLKLIYIAGNEPFTQGPVHYTEAISAAKRKGIIVNTIHCGGDEPTWREGARYAGGSFLMIDQNQAVAQVVAPQDAELARLGAALNRTYVAYGSAGVEGRARQEKMDSSAASAAPAAAAERAVAKAGRSYDNSGWDLVDAAKNKKVKIAEVPAEALPEPMKKMSPKEREAYVETQAKERAQLQQQIAKLNAERKKFLETEEKKRAAAGPASLDTALGASIRQHAETVSIDLH